MLKLKMMLCVMMLPLVVVVMIKAVCQSVREATTASGVDNAASPRLADTAERDYFTLKEAGSLCKNNWKEPRSILTAVRELFTRWATHAIIGEKAYALPEGV